jgi:hypothetical protein
MITRQGYLPDGTFGAASFSADGRFRYWLLRKWDQLPSAPPNVIDRGGAGQAPHPEQTFPMIFICLNPSTADHMQNDPSVTRMMNFAKREGCGGLVVMNVFALRSTDPKALLRAHSPMGPYNLEMIRMQTQPMGYPPRQPVVVAAWGAHVTHKQLRPGAAEVERTLYHTGVKVSCLGTTKSGYPKHPLYLPADTPLRPYSVRA